MSRHYRADVVIVGAGMVGSSLALALADSGLQILLLDAAPMSVAAHDPQAPYEPRVSALSAASQRFLQHLGAWEGIVRRRAAPYSRMHVWDGSGTGSVHFDAGSVHADVLGHIVENRVVQDALLECLLDADIGLLGGTKVETLHQLNGQWHLLLDNHAQVSAPLMIGADGARSIIRDLGGFETREWDYLHHALVTSVRCSEPHGRVARQRFTDNGPLAFLPLEQDGDQHWCSIVWSCDEAQAKALQALDDQAFCQALERAFEGALGRVEHADARYRIPLRQRHAKRYVAEGLALVGDAAHTIHPLAGQGVNLGFMDTAALAEALLHAIGRGENFASKRVLGRYERRRMPHNLGMMAAMEGFQRLFQADPLPVRWARNEGLRQVERWDEAKALFIRRALGLEGDIPAMAQ
ncbi:2-octaprenyl-3-methyl-6-methoxy-1,4-benzoquinol hydroxylase [Pseudomonas sp. A3.4]|nr:2-octaprenyl-3-methyl-6-methoxy-1,4-benzoquinol hydroxylase [Atopomonas sediminilitoris]MCJ8168278.1 2-octaprenyl-3-methyl-6-methoxy-1,4-benzoquinol hydroxylase [Atopomonas sediminilitoris]